MELWEREIVAIQKNKVLSAQGVILIEPHRGLREMLSYAVGLLGTGYLPIPMTFEQSIHWLQQSEYQQRHPSIFLFDCSENSQLDSFLAQLRASRKILTSPLRALGMTAEPSSRYFEHSGIDAMLLKPFRIADLRTHILRSHALL